MNPINTLAARDAEPLLADAFSAFATAAGQLEYSYRELQKEVVRLRRELETRNAAMAETLNENQSMRLALRRILDILPCGVAVLESTGEAVFLNFEAQRLLETPEFGDQRAAHAHGDARRRLAAITGQVLPGGEEREVQIPGAAQAKWVAARSSMMRSTCPLTPAGSRSAQHDHVVLTFRDITTQKELEKDRDETEHLIALARMSAVLAHEIRNPLASMELLVGLLYGCEGLQAEQRSWIDGLRAGLRSLSATVNNVLRYHSLGTAVLLPVQLSQVIRESIQFVQPLAKQAEITLLFDDELGELKIAGNSGELQQVLFNLTLNAFRHTARGGSVRVAAHRGPNGNQAVVEVADTGEGIREEDLPRLFEAGFSGTGQNPGLGLAVCKKIVEQHRGGISVTSQIGSGSTFRMEFPLL
ncbi:MAG TPA: ATP-binding protein [Terriglobales bacterium]|nr:ATP-binding protein [Terriglobales bacterium]